MAFCTFVWKFIVELTEESAQIWVVSTCTNKARRQILNTLEFELSCENDECEFDLPDPVEQGFVTKNINQIRRELQQGPTQILHGVPKGYELGKKLPRRDFPDCLYPERLIISLVSGGEINKHSSEGTLYAGNVYLEYHNRDLED